MKGTYISLGEIIMKTGELIRKIRLEKGIKANYVYNDLMSRSSSYKYEHGQDETTAINLVSIVERLNLDFPEFCNLFERETNNHKRLETYRKNLFANFRQAKLKDIKLVKDQLEKFYKRDPLLSVKHLILIADAMYKKLEKIKLTKEKEIILKYLKKNNNWGFYEYQLLSDSLFMLDAASLKNLFSTNDKWREFYKDENNLELQVFKIQVLFKIVIFFMISKFSEAEFFLKILNDLPISENDVQAKCYQQFANGLRKIQEENFEEGVKVISDVLTYCQVLNLDNLFAEFATILKKNFNYDCFQSGRV